MGLQLVLGGSGSGKSTFVFDRIIKQSLAEEMRTFLILVPDQFTMETQRELVNRHPRGGILNIDVLSFSRLAHRIFEETGMGGMPVLDDTGKSLVLRKVAEEKKEALPVLRSHLKKNGYIHEVKSVISEFMQYGIGDEELEAMLSFSAGRGSLHYKLQDIRVLYQSFRSYIREKFIATEETLDLLARALKKSSVIRDSVVVLDGFTGFTPVQYGVIRQLLVSAQEVLITVTIDEAAEKNRRKQMQGMFALSSKTMAHLERLAAEENIPLHPSVILKDLAPRFEAGELAHLEKYLFRYPLYPYEAAVKNIRIAEAGTMEEEVREAGRRIRLLLREGYAYRDIAVISTDLAAYGSLIEEVFEEFEIPCFMDRTRAVIQNPLIEYIRSALQAVLQQYSYTGMFHFLRSGMTDADINVIDKLENYVLEFGIKGKKTWSQPFVRVSDRKRKSEEEVQNELTELNTLREMIMTQLSVFESRKQTCRQLAETLYGFLVESQCQKKLKVLEERCKERGDAAGAMEYAQVYRLVMELLDQVVGLLGEEEMTLTEFAEILDAGFGEIRVGTIPQAVDRVVAGDMERTRLKQVKALLVLGVNDGRIPKSGSRGGLLSDLDREFLEGSQVELAPTPRQQMFIQKFYLYLNVTKPSCKLFLSYARSDREGKAQKPSYFIASLQRLFPRLETVSVASGEESAAGWERLQTIAEGRMAGAGLMKKYAEAELTGEEELLLHGLLQAFSKEVQGEQWIGELTEAAFLTYYPVKLGREVARLLYGNMIQSSVSRLETMASCAYAHFLRYGLGLTERKEYSFEAVDMGNVFHGVLELFSGKLAQHHYTWMTFPREEGKRLLWEALESYAAAYGNTVLFSSARNAYLLEAMRGVLERTVETLQYQLQKGKFLPENYEISFSVLEDLASVNLSLSREERLRLSGRIDRMDVYEDRETVYVKVMDYKSGKHRFQLAGLYYGLQLQLVIYMNAAVDLQRKRHPHKRVVPAAFLYYHVADPMVEGSEGMTEEEITKQIYRELCVTGIVNEDPAVLQGLDEGLEGKSDVIPVEYKKDGTVSGRSSVFSSQQMQTAADYALEKAKQLGRDMAEGVIAVNPCTFGSDDACQYCQFRRICGFDRRIPGYEKRLLEELPPEELWQRMRETVAMGQGEEASGDVDRRERERE
ncbi:MAG: helicase-exonuclease AddAB subunit AddB [Lachnospiraceae bacterium]|nr:helicase-exonuclease AddAB subunit AddB [Lachnospiraceae bacterium]